MLLYHWEIMDTQSKLKNMAGTLVIFWLALCGNISVAPSEVLIKVDDATASAKVTITNRSAATRYFVISDDPDSDKNSTKLRIFPDQFSVPPDSQMQVAIELDQIDVGNSYSTLIMLNEIFIDNGETSQGAGEVRLAVKLLLPVHVFREGSKPRLHLVGSAEDCATLSIENRGDRHAYLSDYIITSAGKAVLGGDALIELMGGDTLIEPGQARRISIATLTDADCGEIGLEPLE